MIIFKKIIISEFAPVPQHNNITNIIGSSFALRSMCCCCWCWYGLAAGEGFWVSPCTLECVAINGNFTRIIIHSHVHSFVQLSSLHCPFCKNRNSSNNSFIIL